MKPGTRRRVSASFSVLLIFVFLTPVLGAPSVKTYTVGVVLPLNDQLNETVASTVAGIKAAKELFEQDFSVNINIKFFSYDRDLESVSKAAEKVIKSEVSAVIGGENSEEALMLARHLEPAKIVMITPTSSNPMVTKNKKYIFRANLSDTVTGEKIADFVANKLKADKVGLVRDISSPYTDYLSSRFLEAIDSVNSSRVGRRISVLEEKIVNDTANFEKIIVRFKRQRVKFVVMLTRRGDVLTFAIQGASKNYFPTFVGCDGWGTLDGIHERLVKKSPSGSRFKAYVPSYWNGEFSGPLAQRFKKTYNKFKNEQPNSWSAIGFDAAWILFSSLQASKDQINHEELAKSVHNFNSESLITTKSFSFGVENSPVRPLHFFRIDARGIRLEKSVQ